MTRRLVALVVLFAPVPAFAADPTAAWVGEKVFARRPGESIVYVDGPTPGSRVPTTLLFLDYVVLAEEPTHVTIRLKVDGKPARGRIGKVDVVRLADAPTHFSAMLAANPKNSGASIQRGWAYHLLDRTADAGADYDAAVAARPKTWFVWNNRALIRLEAGDLDGALADAEEAAKLEPKSPLPVYNRGLVRLRRENYSAAVREFEAAMALDPTYAPAYLDRGAAHEGRGDYDLAAADYEAACRLDPGEAFGWARRAWLLAARPEAAKRHGPNAVGFARLACELSHWKRPECVATLAAAYAEAGKWESAVTCQTRALADENYRKNEGDAGDEVLEGYRKKVPRRIAAPP